MIITISGRIGAGKSTAAKVLANKLGFQHHSTGDIMREMAKEKSMSPAEFSKYVETEKSFDKELDEKTIELGKTKDNIVMDSRLAFHFIPDSIKIFLDVRPDVAAERIFKQKRADEKENISLEDTKENIKLREKSEIKRYQELYGLDYTNKKQFDLVIDTSDLTLNETVNKIADFVEKQKL